MRFTPLSDKQLEEQNLIPDGFYRYKVLEANDRTSQAGSEMIELKVEIYIDGNKRMLFDYLLESMMHKIKHFCDANNLVDKYDTGTLTKYDCVGKSGGRVQIFRQKDKKGIYADKSAIKDYVPLEMPETSGKKNMDSDSNEPPPFDDDVLPF